MPAGDSRLVWEGSTVELQDNTSLALATDTIVKAATNNLLAGDWLFVRFFLIIPGLSAGPSAGQQIQLLAQSVNVAGVPDGVAPTPTHPYDRYDSKPPLGSAAQTLHFPRADLMHAEQAIHVLNSTGVTINAGWQLLAERATVGPTP